MSPIKFPEANVVIAKDQPQYRPLPAFMDHDAGIAFFCWKLTWPERLRVLFTGVVWHQVLTFNKPLQPQLLTTTKPIL